MLKQPEITFEDVKIIRDFEGHSLKAYPDPASKGEPYTISYGITGAWVKKDTVITQDESDKIFMDRIDNTCFQIDSALQVSLKKNQYVAVLSFVWNEGIGSFKTSTLLKLINVGKFKDAALEFPKWNKAGGKVLKGLTIRRAKEQELFKRA